MGNRTPHASHAMGWRSLVVALVCALALAPSTSSLARPGVDDYPDRLRNTVQGGIADQWNFWNRECTSFVAWRLNNDRNIPFHNYFLGPRWSDASNWAAVATGLGIQVNDAATKGAVAWWPRNSPGSTPGHVAYVLDAGAGWVKIEEYNYATRGGYGKRTLLRGTSSYPEGFIHFEPLRFKPLANPNLEGTTQVGEVLIADRGEWWPTTVTPEISYAWFADGRRIRGADRRRLRLPGEIAGTRVTVKTVARRTDIRKGVAHSTRTTKVKRGTLDLRQAPVVVGTPEVGAPLTASAGVTRPAAQPEVQWLVEGQPVTGETGTTYTPRPEDVGKTVTTRVRQSLLGYRTLGTTSAPSTRVALGTLAQTAPPTLPDDPRVGSRLRVDPGGWPRETDFSYQWRSDGDPVDGATQRGFTPTADELGTRLSVVVTAAKTGYRNSVVATAASAPVALGTLISKTAPSIADTPQVGKSVTVRTGRWSRRPEFTVQWQSDGVDVRGATGQSFTPAPEHVHTRLSARITAVRDGYRDAVSYASALKPTARGTVARITRPGLEGTAWVGQTLTSTLATWSVEPDDVRYRWLADGLPIRGENSSTLQLTRKLLGSQVVVQQRMTAAGYRPIISLSRPVVPTRGEISWTRKPVLSGRPVAGRPLAVATGATDARRVNTSYRWMRDGSSIRGATGSTYSPTPADVGHRISVRVRAAAADWDSAETVLRLKRRVLAATTLRPKIAVSGKRATLTVGVRTPGKKAVGTLTVVLDGREKVVRKVDGAPVTVRLGRLSAGGHSVRVRFAGDGATKAAEKVRFRVGR